jgi:DNA repair/transcription protein MET18/MMS19
LIDVVKSLGEYINDENDQIRARAISYLTAVVSALPPTFLSRQQIQVLSEFMNARIEDDGAIEGLSILQSSSRYTKEMAQDTVKA